MSMLVLVLLTGMTHAVSTEEFASVGGDKLEQSLSDESAELLRGIGLDNLNDIGYCLNMLGSNAAGAAHSYLQSALHTATVIVVIVLLGAAAKMVFAAAEGPTGWCADMACVLACAALLFESYSGLLPVCRETMEQIGTFSAVLQPVLASAVSLTGSVTAAGMLQVGTMLGLDAALRLMQNVCLPLVCFGMAAVAAGAAAGNRRIYDFGNGMMKLLGSALKVFTTLFVSYLLLSSSIAGSSDQLELKAAKMALSGGVPVVGGSLSDAADAMLSGAGLLKNAVGVLGMLCVAAICLLPFLRLMLYYGCFRAAAALLEPLSPDGPAQLLKGAGSGFGLLMGMLGTCSMVLFFELTISILAVKSG